MSVHLPEPSLLSRVTPQDWELTSIRDGVEIWRGQILIEKWHEPIRDKLYEPTGGFQHMLTCWETNKLMAAIRHEGRIVSYAMLSQDGCYGTALPKMKTDICLGQIGVWTHPDQRRKGFGAQAMDGIFGATKALIGLTQGEFHVAWAQAHVASYMRTVARKHLSDFDFNLLSFDRLTDVPRYYGTQFRQVAI